MIAKRYLSTTGMTVFTGCFAVLLLIGLMAGCGGGGGIRSSDTTAPTVTATAPTDGTKAVPINRKVTATFSETMIPINTTTFTLKQGAVPLLGKVTYVGRVATFAPAADLAANTTYTATITTGAKDLAGNALKADYKYSFVTSAAADTTAPTVSSTAPTNGAMAVLTNRTITATFSEAMDPITTTTFTLKKGATPVSGTVTYADLVATFTPSGNLAPNTTYTATVTTGAKDLAGNALATNKVWSFTTAATPKAVRKPVVLGMAGDYAILSKTGISTTGTTSIVGNLGVSPAARSYITGFSETLDHTNVFATSSKVTGKIYAANMAPPTPSYLTTAIGNMETAFTDAAGRTLPDLTELGAGNITGKTLVPGLYKWGTGVLMTSGVTLKGDATDVWIFQIAQDLTVGNGAIVTLSGGAQAKNIFWQVSGKTTLGTTSQFKGIILCKTKIVIMTGAALNGRALAQTAVTLDANNVTQPAL